MARIPQEAIERLKKEVSVERLAEASGVELKRTGKDLFGRCPFHAEDTASLSVTPEKNLWHCFGCGAAGGPIDWAMKANGVSFRHAVELLLADPSLAAGAERGALKHSLVRKLPAPVSLDSSEQELLNQVIEFYHETLQRSPEALGYLKRRGLDDPELLGHFRLGFANRLLGLRLPATRVKAGGELRARLQRIGILRDSGHEHLNGCLVVPVMDETGNVLQAYGRRIDEHVPAGKSKHLNLSGPQRGVWNVKALQASKEVILCEALIDAMSFWRAGFRNVVGVCGTEAFTEQHLAAFKRHGTERVLIAYDRDEPGERAAVKLAESLIGAGLECYRLQFPKGVKDANEYALKAPPAEQSLGALIRKALWLGKGEAPRESPGQAIETAPAPAAPAVAASSLAASPVAAPVAGEVAVTMVSEDELLVAYGERQYRVRGFADNLSAKLLKVNLMVSVAERYHVDTLDLYSMRQRTQYVLHAAAELGVREEWVKLDLGKILRKLEDLQRARIAGALRTEPAAPQMTELEREEALALLRSPDLLERAVADLEACGLVGERTNKLVAYLAAVSRKLERPLALLVQSSSAAGKTSLMDAVLAMLPESECVRYSAMTDQSLFYMSRDLAHKALAIAEEEGAARAAYALKLLQSDGKLAIASTGKDPKTGNLITQDYTVEGPVMLFLTSTAVELDEELLNRCLVLTVDESREQTEAIHRLQRSRRTLAGLAAAEEREHLRARHRNAQALLKPLRVMNPYAEALTFLADKTRTRRDHEKYLTLIDAIALLHQQQRPVKAMAHRGQAIEYVEVELGDIEIANRIAHEVLGRSLDELPPQTRRLLVAIRAHVDAAAEKRQVRASDVRFSRRALREAIGWGDTQLRVHLERLIALEYVLVHRGARGASYEYELLYDGDGSQVPHLSGLIDVATIAASRGGDGGSAGAMRPLCGADAGAVRSAQDAKTPSASDSYDDSERGDAKTASLAAAVKRASYARA